MPSRPVGSALYASVPDTLTAFSRFQLVAPTVRAEKRMD